MIRFNDSGVERRRHARTPIVRPAKLRGQRSLNYRPAATRNLSSSGVLLDLDRDASLAVGDRVELVVAWDRKPVLPRAGALTGTVRRVANGPAGPSLAVEFDRPALSVAVGSVGVAKDAKAA
mgnify:CR=1 FL=1